MICVGHSFMVCVLNAAKAQGAPFKAVVLKGVKNEEHLFELSRSDLIVDTCKPDFGEEAQAVLSQGQPVFSFIGGVNHVSLALRRLQDYPSDPPFDFILPERPDLPLEEGAEIIPYGAMRDLIQQTFSARLEIMTRVVELAPGPIVQFESPPPVSDRILDRWLQKRARELGADARLPCCFLRYRLWRLTSHVFRDHAEELGGRFVENPPEVLDDNGFLRDDLVRNITHGNLEYGAILYERLKQLAAECELGAA